MKVMFNDLSKQWDEIKRDVIPKFENLFRKSDFIGGAAIEEFEENFAKYIGTRYAIGVSNGTDALKISLAALNLVSPCGILIPANTFIATILAVTYLHELKYEIVLVDSNEYYQMDVDLLEASLRENRNKWESCVIIPVHLFGHPCDMERILKLSKEFDCFILEDSSQAHGAMVSNKKVGNFGEISAFSLYPGKNLGAAGDAGIITTNDEDLYKKTKSLRNYGSTIKYYYDFKGWNNRLDTIQAIILNEKLKHLDKWNEKRIEVARKYDKMLSKNDNIIIPKTALYAEKNVYHIYAIRIKQRDDLQEYLKENDIPTVIHYPIPIQKTKPFLSLDYFDNKNSLQFANEMVSLPMHPFLKEEEIDYIIDTINKFYN